MADDAHPRHWRKVGVIWSASGTVSPHGVMYLGGLRQRFVMLPNRQKAADGDPDFVLLSEHQPEPARKPRTR